MPDVPRGSLFIGDEIEPADHKRKNSFIMYEAANLTTHGVIVGMTGSGKTGLGIVLLEECLLQGIPVLVLDPKGDMGNLLLTFPGRTAAEFRPYVLEADAKREGRTLDEHAGAVAKQWSDGQDSWGIDATRVKALHDAANVTIYTPGSSVGVSLNVIGNLSRPAAGVDGEALQDEIDGVVSSLLGLLEIESDPLSGREHILLSNLIASAWTNGKDVDLPALVAQVQQPPMRKLGVIDIDSFYPPNDRMALAMRLNGLIASPAFASWAQGVPLDIEQMLFGGDKPNAAVIQLAHLSDQERQFVVTLILSKVVTWMRQQTGTPDLRALIYMDEVFGFVPPTAAPPAKKPILTIFKQARAFGLGMVLATQNPVDVDYKALSNAGTWMIGRLQTERDKARLMDGLKDAAGATDLEEIDRTISGLAKREFLLHSSKANKPKLFTSRWALSYLPGPLSREQTSALMSSSPMRALAAAATAAASTAATASSATAPLADDESSLAPEIAPGTQVYFLDVAAPWGRDIGADSESKRYQLGVVARVNLTFDDEKAEVREQHEWEAVWFPLDGDLKAADAHHVDYDDRDFREAAPDGAVFVLPKADVKNKAYFSKVKAELQDHLYRTMSIEIYKNADLKLFSRVGESKDDFAKRCTEAGDAKADEAADELRRQYTTKMDRINDAIAKAEDKVREVESDKKRRGFETVASVATGVLGSLFGGKKSAKKVIGSLTRNMGKERMRQQAGERLETAANRLEDQKDELAELEQELTEKLQVIVDEWDSKAARIETLTIELEKTDISVDEIAAVWIPS